LKDAGDRVQWISPEDFPIFASDDKQGSQLCLEAGLGEGLYLHD
jgi:hypothetical protein